ncbi:histone H1 [Megalopta genalis]|uniref:histone H1 n=1 Tax=Megalopta genalis TaxID=115081 RepID=UPI003FCF5B16
MEDKTNSGSAAVSENPTSGSTPAKKVTKSKAKAQRTKSSHPPTSEMVNAAIKELKDRKGSSLQAIKKYITSTYTVDGEKLAPFIRRYLKTAVTSGAVLQTKGKGASGSFKLNTGKSTTETTKAVVEKKTVAKKASPVKKPASPKKSSEKKAVAAKKTAAKAVAKVKAASEPKSMSKAKKTAKAPAAKTKTPKPKKASTSRKSSAGKVAKSPAKK